VSEDSQPQFFGPVGRQRILWHPAVHTAYGESCYFYLISGQDSQAPVLLNNLKTLMESLGVRSAALNVVFGPYDVLAKVWLTPQRRQRMLRLIQGTRSGLQVESILEFQAVGVTYTWTPMAKPDPDLLNSRDNFDASGTLQQRQQEDIAEVVRATSGENLVISASALASQIRLVQDGILLIHTSSVGQKVYLFISQSKQDKARKSGLDIGYLASLVRTSGLRDVSIYQGDGLGFCDYVVKGTADDYFSALPAVAAVQAVLWDRGTTLWTLAPPDCNTRPEGEFLDAVSVLIPDRVRRSIEGVSTRAMKVIEANVNSESAQKYLVEFFDWLTEYLARPEQVRLIEVTHSALLADRRMFNRRLSFLVNLETDTRDAIPLIARAFSKDGAYWRQAFEEMFSYALEVGNSDATRTAPLSWPFLDNAELRDLFRYLQTLTSAYPESENFVARYFGDSWRVVWPDIVTLRDEYMKGRLLSETLGGPLDRDWWLRLRTIGHAIVIQAGLERLIIDLSVQF
jgi:hypothetical protein